MFATQTHQQAFTLISHWCLVSIIPLLQHLVSATAINGARVLAWLDEIPLAKTSSIHIRYFTQLHRLVYETVQLLYLTASSFFSRRQACRY